MRFEERHGIRMYHSNIQDFHIVLHCVHFGVLQETYNMQRLRWRHDDSDRLLTIFFSLATR
jgi:hypothetical protein